MNKLFMVACAITLLFLASGTLTDAATPVAHVEFITSEMEVEWIPPARVIVPDSEIIVVSCADAEVEAPCLM